MPAVPRPTFLFPTPPPPAPNPNPNIFSSSGVFRGIKNSSNPAFQLGRGGAGWNPGENEGRMDEPVVVTDQRLYHPVKCAADPTLGQQALKFTRVSP